MRSPDLTREQKIERLRQIAYDELELDVATGEGMTGPTSELGRVRRVLRELEGEDEDQDAGPR